MTKILIAILSFVIAGAVFFFYTQPTYDSAQAVEADIAEFDGALTKSRELQELKTALLSRYNTFSSEQLGRLTRLLPDHVDNVRLVLDFDSLASRYGMAVQNVLISRADTSEDPSSTVIGSLNEQASTFDSLTLQFTTTGTYDNFVAFLEDLETNLRIVDLVGLTIEQVQRPPNEAEEETESQEPIYRYNVSLRTYWLK